MIKKFMVLFMSLFMLFLIIIPVSALEYESASVLSDIVTEETTCVQLFSHVLQNVIDNADILTDSEESILQGRCEEFIEKYSSDIVILTITDLDGKSDENYADDFYYGNGYGYGDSDDGILVLFKQGTEGDRRIYIATYGTIVDEVTDDEVDSMLYVMQELLVSGEYFEAFSTFIDEASSEIKPISPLVLLPVCLLAGIVIGIIITAIMASGNKSVRMNKNARGYINEGSFVVTGSYERFVRKYVRTYPKPKQKPVANNSSGRSSSGGRRGGGGISF